ncbi:hypothetical protein DD237_007396 [Peronospora effusa]|uniref:RxLR effector protein n=1 Tax=Peronospora effusa TaxID=542832 RepID=A0A425C6T4_9STRA|nr:hypothetical protein DD237_007396 [Peronospora effusa]
MRLYSSLLGATIVLFDYVNTSSARPDSTMVTAITPEHHNQKFLRDGANTNEKERDLLPTVETLTKFASTSASYLEENRLYWKLLTNRESVEKAFNSFKLYKEQLRTLHFNAWVRYAVKVSASVSDVIIEKVQQTYGPGGLAKVLEAFITAKGTKDVVRRLETKLIDSWKAKNILMEEALSHLRLDKSTDPFLREKLLNTWVKYGNTKEGGIEEMVEAIDSCGYEMRVAILEGVRKIEGTDGVVSSALSHLMTYLEERKVDANLVFKSLKLDRRDTKQPRTLHFDAWVKYVAEKVPSSFSKSLRKKVWNLYGDEGRVKMLGAFITAKGADDVIHHLETELIGSWKAKNILMEEALSHLRLDKSTDPLLREKLLNTWVKYGNTKEGGIEEMVEAIDTCDDVMRVAILEGLRKIEGTDDVVSSALSHLMTERKVDANLVFKLLKLDRRDTKQPRTLDFDAWVKYAGKSPTLLSKSTLKSVFKIHGDLGILELAKAYSHRDEDFGNLLNFS